MRWLAVFLLLPLPLMAQEAPKIEVTQPQEPVIPGQPATVRIKVLVPTWMTSPPVYPELGSATLLARLPDRATTSISETIGGETWSGTSRAYRLYPLTDQDVTLSGLFIRVTYAQPGQTDPVVADVAIPDLSVPVDIPAAARDLSPFIAGTGFELKQTLEGGPELATGDAVTRSLTATIKGATPLLIPDLLADTPTGPLRAYPDEPEVTEKEERGLLQGARTQRVTYVAQDGGTASLPTVSVDWYNIQSGKVETATAEGLELTIAPPPRPPLDPRVIAQWLLAGGLLALGWRLAWPQAQRWRRARNDRYQESEAYAARLVHKAISKRDLGATYSALDLWSARSGRETGAVLDALSQIGATTYGSSTQSSGSWREVASAFKSLRAQPAPGASALPPLNFS